MAIALHPSKVTLPKIEPPYPSVFSFLVARFPQVSPEIWQQRFEQGKVLNDRRLPIAAHTPYIPQQKIYYFREQSQEPVVPFAESILFQNDEILVACKPHFLPVIPSGPYVNECLLGRLQRKTGILDLAPIHRIDRETAGVVLFSTKKQNRGVYHDLFMHGAAEKTYQALCHYPEAQQQQQWLIENRIEVGSPWFRVKTANGPINSRTRITLKEARGEKGHFLLQPITGKKHQLRLHLSGLGFGIINDRYYPNLLPKRDDDFDKPLQLIAQALQFDDPITGKRMEFQSERKLLW
ncbi:MAG: pseudouridine synthase [Desulfobulbaceae bacterium]|nr:pseudouridine synthase [Desulfobulbaceae bacterium]